MKKSIFIFSVFSFCYLTVCYGQNAKAKKAKNNYEALAYKNAIVSYEDLIKKGYSGQEIYQNLGNAYYLNANYEEAANWYEQLFSLDTVQIDANYYFRYAQSLKSLKKYKVSREWMEQFIKRSEDDGRAAKYASNKDYLENIKNRSGRYDIKLAELNSKSSDFAPSFFGDQLVFSSARDTGIAARRIHEWNETPFLNLYAGTILENGATSDAKRFSQNLNAKTHESSAVFTKDGKTVYFTRNNSDNGRRFARDQKGVSRLKIFRADLVDGKWKNIIELPFNGDNFSTAHPTLDKDERKLFFASDRPGTFGASDIWVVELFENRSFGTPQNLGSDVNTEGRETFPYITQSDILYFASDGHQGLGGLDIFAAEIRPGQTIDVLNLGEPINTDEDDFSFIIDEKTGKGYFASNRPNGVGSDDIYSFVEKEPLVFNCTSNVSGVVKNSEDGSILANASVEIVGSDGAVLTAILSNQQGEFSTLFLCEGDTYTVIGTKQGFENGKLQFQLDESGAGNTVELFLKPEEKPAKKGADLKKLLALNPIYFDLNSAAITPDAELELEQVVDYMKRFPNVNITIKSHTDSRASDSYNLNLSERRAKATLEYLVNKGIDLKRLSARGYGETQLLNRCANRVGCSKREHDVNRRSEFIVE